jgi:small-conductance mechanosensitive channel
MESLWGEVQAFFTLDRAMVLVRALAIIGFGWLLARLLASGAARVAVRRGGAHATLLVRRAVFYAVFGGALLAGISELGVDLGVLLGAAGILTVALGFASQSSAANVISGAFLLGERAFEIGDTITVGTTTGEVLSIDLLSVKLRTFDNLYVRIPNELLLKTEIRNLSRFPIRRLDMPLTIAYAADLERVREILNGVAASNPLVLDEPRPLLVFTGFGDHGYTLQYSVWLSRERFLEVRGVLHAEVVKALESARISIAMPRQAVFVGAGSEPLPIRMVAPEALGVGRSDG